MEVREIALSDFDSLFELYTFLHDNPLPQRNEKLRSLIDEIMADKNHHIIVALEDGRVISSCVLVVINNLTHQQRPYAIIENVVTHPDFRGRGLATRCLDFAKKIALLNNCYKIMLMTGSKNEKTLSFYENAGYNRKDKTAFIQWL